MAMNLHHVTAQGVTPHATLGRVASIADDAEYGRAPRAVDERVGATGGREVHPLWGLIPLARRFSAPAGGFLKFSGALPKVSAP